MINIAEILKKCSKGTKLYSPICGECVLDYVGNNRIFVKCDDNTWYVFYPDGTYREKNGECLLFPSKENRDWNKFIPFKDGDIVYTDFGSIAILKITTNKYYSSYCGLFSNVFKTDVILTPVRLATEKEKKILFDAIKANGYKWNHETITLEKLLEPRFKIGDWIIADEVHQDYHICQITDIDDNKYYIESIEGYKGFNYFDVFEKLYRQWTIQDAKDGDVLTTDMVHFIFKSEDYMDCYMHCYYSVLINKYVTSYTAIVDSICVHPATKEQRDLLFRKMKESGYEWDAEKKKLRKIGQTPAWSEEDEKILEIITSVLQVNFEPIERFSGYEEYMNVDLINWLRALKDRCTWKPSDKQMEQLGCIAEQNKDNMIGKELMTLYNDLKKLKE